SFSHTVPLWSFFFMFFLDSYVPPRDLHSFPTRRSSDLAGLVEALPELPPRGRAAVAEVEVDGRGRDEQLGHAHAEKCLRRALRRDRKSTRLNSSHLVISYAVFCLKKKKKQ